MERQIDSENLPRISVIVPNYNSVDTIKRCLESLVNISYPKDKLEIIVADNNSTDGSRKIIDSFSVKLVLEKEIQSSYAARNKAVEEGKGDIFAFTDSDCIVDKSWLLNSLKYFENDEIGGIAGKIEGFKPITLEEEYQILRGAVDQTRTFKHSYRPYAQTANAIYKKEVFEKIGGFEGRWISGGDADFSWRMQQDAKLKLVYADDCIVYHCHRTNSRAILKQGQKNTYGTCLLNEKFKNKFKPFEEPKKKWILFAKIAKNQLESSLFLLVYALLRKKEVYFKYLSKIERIGHLRGYLEFINDRVMKP